MLSKEKTADTTEIGDFFKKTGMVGGPGIQINIPVGWDLNYKSDAGLRKEGTFCDHHCAAEGKYVCPAAFSRVDPDTFAPTEAIVEGIKTCGTALRMSREIFLNEDFDAYTARFNIPEAHADVMKEMLRDSGKKVDVNLFGGEPAFHKEIGDIASDLKKDSDPYTAILTTTGSPLVKSEVVAEKILSSPFDLIALSMDGLSAEKINEFCSMDLNSIKEAANAIRTTGSEKKACEAIYTAKLAEGRIPVMFNIVVHPGNLDGIYELIGALDDNFPRFQKNPYFAQSSFNRDVPVFNKEHAKHLGAFIEYMIDEQKRQIATDKRFVPRLHYWLMMEAAYVTFKGNALLKALSGYDVWKCYDAGKGRLIPADRKLIGI